MWDKRCHWLQLNSIKELCFLIVLARQYLLKSSIIHTFKLSIWVKSTGIIGLDMCRWQELLGVEQLIVVFMVYLELNLRVILYKLIETNWREI